MGDYSSLTRLIHQPLDCVFFESIASTNDYLLSQPFSDLTQFCFAREQTKGKGQQGREWRSQKDGSILFSIKKNFNKNLDMSGLSLVIALAIVKSLEELCAIYNLGIKWPNDIYYEGKKLSGILIENQLHSKAQSAVIGVGVNYNISQDLDCETPWIDLKTIDENVVSIEVLTATIVNTIFTFIKRFEENGFVDFQSDWSYYDILKGRFAKVDKISKPFAGEVVGVNNKGALLISSENSIEAMYSSEYISYNSETHKK